MAGKLVLDLHRLPSDPITAAISEFLIVRMHGHLLRGDQPRRLARLVVLDEAHRVAQSERLTLMAREGRAFGVGLIVATQFLRDVPDTISGNLATKVIFQPDAEDAARQVARVITGSSTGSEARAVGELALSLETHQALMVNQHYAPYILVKAPPHFAR